ncbi:ABC-2 family transporter protein [Kitasatospora sp. A2-31]|uniref:ABC transporter permease n=1 Tax=Kitasatospora sp. A2-31 TaxID=2916414 RepID=UPI001EEC3E3B|nr:ABC-2 family transporter protein [Kitasatospora sp. A2-31]MCG6496283.1 ABC-2 family transporter protein [Kitasatospora sp. A2-31]
MLNAVPAATQLRPPPDTGGVARLGPSARLYLAVARAGFRRFAGYRAATLAGTVTNTVFGFILAYTFLALWQARPGLGGYDTTQAVTYIWISQALLATVAVLGGGFQDDIKDRFRSGDIAIDLYRPVDFQSWWLATDLGRACFQLLARGILPTAAGALAFDTRLPHDPAVWAVFLLSVLLAVVVSFGLRFLVSLTGFWMQDAEGIRSVMVVVTMFFSGMLLPLGLFPGWLGELAPLLPWAAMIQIPTDVFLERHSGAGLLGILGLQLLWAALLLAAGRAVQRLATRKVVVQGG